MRLIATNRCKRRGRDSRRDSASSSDDRNVDGWLNGDVPATGPHDWRRQYASVEMHVEVRAARPGDGAGLARVWLENASYYVRLFPDDFRMPNQVGLVESFEVRLGRRGARQSCGWSLWSTVWSRRLSTRG
jgi:hypothetical protein